MEEIIVVRMMILTTIVGMTVLMTVILIMVTMEMRKIITLRLTTIIVMKTLVIVEGNEDGVIPSSRYWAHRWMLMLL